VCVCSWALAALGTLMSECAVEPGLMLWGVYRNAAAAASACSIHASACDTMIKRHFSLVSLIARRTTTAAAAAPPWALGICIFQDSLFSFLFFFFTSDVLYTKNMNRIGQSDTARLRI